MTASLKKSFTSAIAIIKLILPILFAIEILKYYQLIEPLSILLSPILELLELPNEFAIIWIVGIFTGIYGAIATFFYIATNPESYTIAQVSILSVLILVVHALPIEAKISQYLGVNYWKIIFFRFAVAIIYALIVKYLTDFFGLLQEKVHLTTIITTQQDSSIFSIITGPIITCIEIGVIIVVLYMIIDFLKKVNVIRYIELILKPITYILKIDNRLSNSLLIGMVLGLSYGGAILIEDLKNLKKVSNKEKNKVVYLLNILHSLIEDTILVLLIGANIFVVLLGRIVFSILIMLLINIYHNKIKRIT